MRLGYRGYRKAWCEKRGPRKSGGPVEVPQPLLSLISSQFRRTARKTAWIPGRRLKPEEWGGFTFSTPLGEPKSPPEAKALQGRPPKVFLEGKSCKLLPSRPLSPANRLPARLVSRVLSGRTREPQTPLARAKQLMGTWTRAWTPTSHLRADSSRCPGCKKTLPHKQARKPCEYPVCLILH